MESFINTVNGIVWSPALVYLCLGAGLFSLCAAVSYKSDI